jgi:allantoin racemase
MSKRIAILGTGDADTGATAVPAPIRTAAAAGCRPELVAVPGAVFPGTPADRDAAARAYLSTGLAAADDGYDALYINTVGDYGLAELRRQVGVPVTGSGESALRLAQSFGGGFAIVTIWPPALGFIYAGILAAAGAADQCRGVHHLSTDPDLATLGQPGNFVSQLQACTLTSMARIRTACRAALDDGAGVIVLGCTCMQPTAAKLRAEGMPIIEPMVTGYRYTQLLLAG